MSDHEAKSSAEEYYDLGSFHRALSYGSKEPSASGLVWSYAFNHEEAVDAFEEAIKHDPKCAMAYWGLAYALGPNYNKPWDSEEDLDATVRRAYRAVEQAEELSQNASHVEKALIGALQARYPQDHGGDYTLWTKLYAEAMGSVYARFPDDLDVAALYAESLMNLTPWKLWDLVSGKPMPNSRTLDAKEVLESTFSKDKAPTHPGLLHLHIHLMEMSRTPEAALPSANRLRDLVPDSGHLRHMPSHIDILCGDWQRAISSNSAAIDADERFLAPGDALKFYTLYRAHNYHFRIYAAMFSGASKVAIDTVARLEDALPEVLLRTKTPPMADWLEGFLSVRVHVLVRFGRWQDIINLGLPGDVGLYCNTTAMIHYGKGVAFAATGNIPEAEKQRQLFQEAVKLVPSTRTLFNNKCVDILAIASTMLDGEISYRRRDFDVAFSHLRKSIELCDKLPYEEPWGWMQPPRHAYGALLLEQGHIEEAAAVYSADLGFDNTLPRAVWHPDNVWALAGYYECLTKLGRDDEARIVKPKLDAAIRHADIPIKSSCFCRL